MKKFLIIYLLLFCSVNLKSQFIIDDVQVGTSQYRYLDPEFVDGFSKVCWIDLNNKIWAGNLDPLTGLFFSVHGLDLLIDSNVVPIDSAFINGPEWGADFEGPAVFYTKRDSLGIRHVWRAITTPILYKTKLTSGNQHHIHWQGTISSLSSFINIFLLRYDPQPSLYWCNENNIVYTNPITNHYWGSGNMGNGGPRFILGTDYFVYSRSVNSNKIEIVRVNTLNNTFRYITNDNIPKVDVFGFISAEYNNQICYAARISDTTIGVYRFVQPTDTFATRFATLRIPVNDPHKYLFSMEAVQPSIQGTTYFAVLGNLTNNPQSPIDGSMWILGLGLDSNNRFARRVDEGAVSGLYRLRNEPEPMIGQNELFLYYNVQISGVGQLRRCRTGIFLNPVKITTISNDTPDKYLLYQNYPNPFNPSTNIKYQLTSSNIVTLKVFDINGKEIVTLVNEKQSPGTYSVDWDASQYPSGVYFYTLITNTFTETRKMTLIK
jgi:hypothetical protein